jgi:hypothetical protein
MDQMEKIVLLSFSIWSTFVVGKEEVAIWIW